MFGVADITVAQDFICKQGGESLRKFSYAISIGIRLLDSIVDELHRHKDLTTIFTYKGLYNTVNSRLDHIALLIAKRIQRADYQAYPIPASQSIDSDKLIGVISHKLPANLAGLGWIGKSCLLITPDFGPRIRFATILTNAPLNTGHPMNGKCNDCSECVNICPVKAFTGASFNPSDPREVRFHAYLCDRYSESRRAKLGEGICGLCVYICPYGRRNSESEEST
ncbi:MAG: epoxyqueuosine reductase [Candidatus Bathyarchaeota archaeon]|nr:MAG: epoxyqueuosine reductase [Candidatus Bathyarchaeota archaeon]